MRIVSLATGLVIAACGGPDTERLRSEDLEGAALALELNIAAIQRHDTEAYLAQYVDSPELVIAAADSVRRDYFLFAEWRRASDEWPDTLVVERPTLVWIGPGVVWAAFQFTSVVGGDTVRGVSERVFVETPRGWKIAVTGTLEECTMSDVRSAR